LDASSTEKRLYDVYARIRANASDESKRAAYIYHALFYSDGAGAVTLQSSNAVSTIESDAAWNVTPSASGLAMRMRVTGEAA